jgi:hypothetical protein
VRGIYRRKNRSGQESTDLAFSERFVKRIANVRVIFRVRRSFSVRRRSFAVQSDTHAEGAGCTFRHTVEHVHGRL